jgi:large subunit ribosomal protein L10
MSKVIKQMEMDALRATFKDVRDLVVLSVSKLSAQNEYAFRAALRKKKIQLRVVKNSLTRKVFHDLKLQVPDDSPYWLSPTMLAWGMTSVSELSRAIDSELKSPKTAPLYKEKVVIKGAIADGQPIPFPQALTMPTRTEAIARVVALALSPGARLMSQVKGPGGLLVGQIQSLKDKEVEGAAPAAS